MRRVCPCPRPSGHSRSPKLAATTFGRSLWYDKEAKGHFRLVRIGARTLVPSDVVDRLMSGDLVILTGPRGRALNRPKPNPNPKNRACKTVE